MKDLKQGLGFGILVSLALFGCGAGQLGVYLAILIMCVTIGGATFFLSSSQLRQLKIFYGWIGYSFISLPAFIIYCTWVLPKIT